MAGLPPIRRHATGNGDDSINNQLTRERDTDDGQQSVSKRLKIEDKEQDISPLEYALHSIRLQRLKESRQHIFIPPMAKANLQARDDALFPLMEKMQEFLASEREVMLILGDSGAGKSTITRYLEHQLWTGYEQGGPIPLYINLLIINNPAQDIIEKQLQILDFSENHICELKEYHQLILICDGYDESQLTVNLHNINRLNQQGEWRAKMIISCRSQFLGSFYMDQFAPQPTGHCQAARSDLFQEAVIAPFSKEQIEHYVTLYISLEPRIWITEDYMRMLTSIPDLMGLVRNPFLLTLALEALPAFTERKQHFSAIRITRVQLYDIFVVHWLNVNKRRLESNILSTDDRIVFDQLLDAGFISMGIDYSMRLASAIFERQGGNPMVQYIHVQDNDTWKTEFFGTDPEVRLLQESAPLTRSGNQFLFVHRSMLEYFFSRVIYSPVKLDEEEFVLQVETTATSSLLFDGSSPIFRRNLLVEPSIIQFLCDRVSLHPKFEQQLRVVIDQSKTDDSATIAATNAITILVKAGANFYGADLRDVKIPGADLSGGHFDSVQFQGADLRNVSFAGTWLQGADLCGALMEGVQFGELPYLEANEKVTCCAYSPNGKLLAMGLEDRWVEIYDTSCWKRVFRLRHDGEVFAVAFSPDGSRIVSGSYKRLQIWECSSGNEVLAMTGNHLDVTSVAFSPCGRKVASSGWGSKVQVWDSQTGDGLFGLECHTDWVRSVTFSPDGQQLVSGDDDGMITFWDPKTGKSGVVLSCSMSRIYSLAYSPDGRWIASGHTYGGLQIWNAASYESGPVLQGHTHDVTGIAFSPDSQLMASSSDDCTVRLWDVSTGAFISKLEDHGKKVRGVAFSPNGSQLASASYDKTVRLWEVNSISSSSEQKDRFGHALMAAYSPDGRYIISINDRTVQQHDAATGASGSVSLELPMTLSISYLVFSSDGNQIATASDDCSVQLWDLRTGVAGPVLKSGSTEVLKLEFSPCCRWLVFISLDGNVRLWDLRNLELRWDVEIPCGGIYSVAFSHGGHQFALGSKEGDVFLFNPKSRALRVSKKLSVCGVTTLAYSPNDQQLAVGSSDHSICLWDLQSDAAGIQLQGHKYIIEYITYSPCGQWITSSSYDKTLRLWRRQALEEVESWSCVASIQAVFGSIACVLWNPVVPLEFIAVSNDKSFRVLRVSSNEGGDVAVIMLWGTNLRKLYVEGLVIEDVQGLSSIYQKLLVQRGAISSILDRKEQQ